MAVYPLIDLKNLITDRIHDNHARTITGEELQELLQDILDSLQAHTDAAVVEPAVNYYVNQILWDAAIGALTLIRAGGITPVDISVDLDGRYRLISDADHRAGTVELEAGLQYVEFSSAFPDGTIPWMGILDAFNASGVPVRSKVLSLTNEGFEANFDEAVTLPYYACIPK